MPVTWASDFLNDVASAVVTLKTMLTLDDGSADIMSAWGARASRPGAPAALMPRAPPRDPALRKDGAAAIAGAANGSGGGGHGGRGMHVVGRGEANGAGASSVPAMAQLAEGIQGVVKNMRNEQQMLRDWIEAQHEESQELRRTLQRLTDKLGDR